MNSEHALELLLKFFKGEPPFEEARLMVGHASSQIPALFLHRFSELSLADQKLVLRVLVKEVLDGQVLAGYLPKAAVILSQTAHAHRAVFAGELLDPLEAFISREDRIRTWLSDIDSEEEGKDYRSSWRFALHLWNVLASVNSAKAATLYERFHNEAKDEHFSRSIETAKRVHEGSSWLNR